jgi:hypothetical protein
LKNLLKAWGVGFKNDMVIADMNYRGMLQGRNNPTALLLPAAAINPDDRITSGLNSLTLVTAGSFSIDKREGIDANTLVSSSEESAMIDITEAEKARSPQGLSNFTSSGRKQWCPGRGQARRRCSCGPCRASDGYHATRLRSRCGSCRSRDGHHPAGFRSHSTRHCGCSCRASDGYHATRLHSHGGSCSSSRRCPGSAA